VAPLVVLAGVYENGVLLHTVPVNELLKTGVGLTVMVNEDVEPEHPLATGVTVIVDIIGAVPGFDAMNDAIFPLPVPAARPIDVLLFQLNTVPDTGPLNVTAVVALPLHTV
jgi:hypothetical protein